MNRKRLLALVLTVIGSGVFLADVVQVYNKEKSVSDTLKVIRNEINQNEKDAMKAQTVEEYKGKILGTAIVKVGKGANPEAFISRDEQIRLAHGDNLTRENLIRKSKVGFDIIVALCDDNPNAVAWKIDQRPSVIGKEQQWVLVKAIRPEVRIALARGIARGITTEKGVIDSLLGDRDANVRNIAQTAMHTRKQLF